MRHNIAPVRWRRIGQRRLNDLEIDRTIRVRPDQQPLTVIADIIGDAGAAFGDQPCRSFGSAGIDQPDFRCVGMIMRVDPDEAAALGLADAEEKPASVSS